MTGWLKKNWGLIILSIISISLDIYSRQILFTILLIYGLFIKLLLSEYIHGGLRRFFAVVIWSAFIGVFGLGFYVNHYLPHGPSYPTGDYVCQNDDRGPCGEVYKEDMRGLNIPDWAKFFRGNEAVLIVFGLGIAGIVISNKDKNKNEGWF